MINQGNRKYNLYYRAREENFFVRRLSRAFFSKGNGSLDWKDLLTQIENKARERECKIIDIEVQYETEKAIKKQDMGYELVSGDFWPRVYRKYC